MVDKFSKIVCLLLTILPVCKSNNNNSQLANYNKYLLPKNVLPLKYYIKLTPHLHNDVYMGYIKIQINVTKNTNNITMHQNGLVIQPEKVYLMRISSLDDNRTIINHDGISKSVEEDFYIIQFNQTLLPGIYELVIPQYFGVYRTNSMTGLYSVTYHEHHNITQKLVLSYFEPTYARYAFPCFDEPELKARFKIFIIRPWNYQSGSNGILIKSTYLHNSLVEDEFEETNLLPTYTIAFFVSNLAISKKVKGSIHQILARPKLIKEDQVKSFLELAKRASDNIATFVKKQLPLKKIYHIAIPENKMLYPAMENSGIITYWESNLFRPNDSTIGRIEAITNVIVHELVHEWFGNLVTLKWWNFFWLNEGMAVYLAYKITDNLYPEWSKMQDLQIAVLNIMKTDSENDSTSLNHYCNSPEDIYLYKFTPLILNKGAAMIRMMESILSTEIFRKGLQYYVNDREFKSATPDDLYKNLDKAVRDSNIKLLSSVSHIMETWDSQRGFPIVEVKRNYGFDSFNVQLTQKWCILYNFFKSKPIWFIPINYATKSNPNFYNQQASDWLTKEKHNIKIKDLRKNDWLILNTKGTYYYRVNYDLRNWDLISKALMYNHKEIDLHNRAQIIDDAFSLAKLGVIPYRIPLKVSEYFFKEMDYAPLKVMKEVFDDLKVKLMGTSAEQNFITYFTKGVVSVYDQLENRDQTMENHIHQKAVLLIFSWLCELQHKKCFARVDSMFKDYRSGKTLPVDLEEQVLCTSMERGQEPHWFYLFETIQFKKEREYNRYLTLACSTNSMLLQRFLVYSATLLQKTELVKAFQAVIQQGRIGFKVSLRFIMKRFKALMDRLETNDMKIILTSLSSKITTAEDLEVLEKLSNTHKKTFRDLFEPGILKAHENIEWNNKYQNEINTYLGNFDRSGTASYFNTLGIKNFNIMMFYVGVGILY